ncbi:MAG: MFS transporter [Candidatus Colwellbacteria bacterium]|nr:MFS transporter [Candidatus Colwellbacteria bacterium]
MAEERGKRIFGLRKNVFFLGLVSLFNDFSNEMIQSVMPVFLSVTLGVSPVFVGIIEGAADAVASFLKIFSGWLSDRTGKRKSIAVLGYALSISMRPIYAFATSFSQIVKLRMVDRIGKGLRDSPRDALLSESSGPEELGRSFGYHRAMDAIGGIAGPLAAVIMLPMLGGSYRSLFLIAFIVGLFVLLSFVFVKDVGTPKKKSSLSFNIGIFREHKEFGYFLTSIFIFGMGTLPITLMLLRPIELGAKLANIPLMYLAYSLTFVLSAIPFGRLSDKVGERIVIPFGFIAAIASYVLLAFAGSIEAAVLAFMFFGVYSAATDGIERALTSKLVRPESLATGQGFLHAAVGISSLLAGLIGGLLWTNFGSAYAFIYGAGFSVVGLIFFMVMGFRSKKNLLPELKSE